MTEASVLRLSSKYETAAGANSNKGLVRNGKPLCLFRFQIGSKWHGFEEHWSVWVVLAFSVNQLVAGPPWSIAEPRAASIESIRGVLPNLIYQWLRQRWGRNKRYQRSIGYREFSLTIFYVMRIGTGEMVTIQIYFTIFSWNWYLITLLLKLLIFFVLIASNAGLHFRWQGRSHWKERKSECAEEQENTCRVGCSRTCTFAVLFAASS